MVPPDVGQDGVVARSDRHGETLTARLAPRFPFAEHSLVAAEAALAESRGDLSDAAERYSEAASRWERFPAPHEQGFALFGRGRCLLGLSDLPGATDALRQARDLFARCGMRPALEETDDLLASAIALTS